MHWQLHLAVIHPLCPVTCLRHFKGGAHLLGEFLVVFLTGDLCELPPPRQHLYMPCLSLYPIWGMQGGFQIFGCWQWWGWCWCQWQADSHLSACQGGFLPTQELLEVVFQGWGTFEIFIPLAQNGPSLLPWSWPIGHFVCHLFGPPCWWGQLVGHIYLSVIFQALLLGGHSLLGKCHPTSLPGGTGWLGPFLSSAPLAWNHIGHLSVLEEINAHLSRSVGVYLGTF